METINITKKRFESLEKYQIPNYVFNTEGTLYILPIKNRWDSQIKLLKRLYLTNGMTFGNKLQTINSLVDNKEKIEISEIVFPEKIAVVNSEIVGFTMPLIESVNLKTALKTQNISNERKIKYLKQIGNILEEMKKVRTYTDIKDFFINDLHESNFIVDPKTDSIRVVDIDSCKINGNFIFNAKYLTLKSLANQIPKYKRAKPENIGYFVPDENTDIFCYIIVILNFLYGDNISNFTLEEFYNYLDYLQNIGLDTELIYNFERIVSNSHNENPYELLDSILPIIGRSNHHVYAYNKNRNKHF